MKEMIRKPAAAILLLTFMIISACGQPGDQPDENGRSILVAVFSNRGASATCVKETMEALKIDPGITPFTITAARMMADSLKGVDVLVFPGGSGSTQYNSMGLALGDMVRDFVLERGKGVVGICAGAYLISDTEDYPCLGMLSAEAVDIEHDKRGSAVVEARFTEYGLKMFPEMNRHNPGYIQYHDGPLLVPGEGAAGAGLTSHATFISDVHCNPDAPAGMTPGKAFMVSQKAGRGRVFACAGHPESTRGMRWLVPRMVRWTAGKESVTYGSEVVRPQIGDREIMHDDAREKELFWRLFDEDPRERIAALDTLMKLRHRNGFRWAVGLLRDRKPAVRARAARALAEAEYTAALGDLEVALQQERDRECRAVLRECATALREMIAR